MPGTYIFRPIQANLTHDTDWLGKMDPYCSFMMNNKRVKGQVCKSGGQHPVWNDEVRIPVETNQPACVVELMDKDRFIDDSIGTFVIDLNEVQNHGTLSKWYPVFHKNAPAGQILLESSFQPTQPLIQQSQPLLVETPVTVIQETIVEKRVIPEERVLQTTLPAEQNIQREGQFLSGIIPVGGDNLDGGLYGKVVRHQPLSNLPDHPIGSGQSQLMNQPLPGTHLGGPLSGSLGGGLLGTTELVGNQLSGSQIPRNELYTNNLASNIGGSQLGGAPLAGSQLGGAQLTPTEMSNAQIGGGVDRGLYKQFGGATQGGLNQEFNQGGLNQGFHQGGLNQGFNQGGLNQGFNQGGLNQGLQGQNKPGVVPGDMIGAYNQTNQGLGGANPNLGNRL